MTKDKNAGTRQGRRVGKGQPPPEYEFAPGESGNPRGRPRGALGLKGQLRRQLRETLQMKDGTAVQAAEAIARTVVKLAHEGDLRAVQLLLSCSPEELERAGEPAASAAGPDDDAALIDDTLLSRNMKNDRNGE
jgi:hypothetical protein